MSDMLHSGKMPVLALRGLAVFPDQTIHFDVGRRKSILALEAAMKADQTLLLIPQRNLMDNDPALEQLYTIGTVAKVKQVLKSQGENLRVLVTGLCRAKISNLTQFDPYLEGQVTAVPETEIMDNTRGRALRREANTLYGMYLEMTEHPAQAIHLQMMTSEDSGFVADAIGQHSGIDFPEKVKLLAQLNPVKRLEMAVKLLRQELEILQLETMIQEKTLAQMDQYQKDY